MDKTYREYAIEHLKQDNLCKGYVDYILSEMTKLEQIEQVIGEWNDNWQLSQKDLWMYLAEIKEILEQE